MQNSCCRDILTDTEEIDVKNDTESKICIKRARTILYEMLKKSGINDSYHRSFLLYGDFRYCQD